MTERVGFSVIIPTHNPDAERLRRTLEGLRRQQLHMAEWETIVVNNASLHFPPAAFFQTHGPSNLSHVEEPVTGLTPARIRGFEAARGAIAVLVDDDNVLAPDYLVHVKRLFAAHPEVGLLGGKSIPEFESEPPAWSREFFPLLALRDPGDRASISQGLRPHNARRNEYPLCAPIGAGMALRRAAWKAWVDARRTTPMQLSDRRGTELTSSGDNDIVFCGVKAGWAVGYFPELSLTHLIPSSRLEPNYLARLNRGIQKSWQQVLALHDASPWPALTPLGATVRKFRAWFTHRAWSSTAAQIRWHGACGHFEGRVAAQTPG
jgi:glycosyltransferase involved in cell wall biosynthesis